MKEANQTNLNTYLNHFLKDQRNAHTIKQKNSKRSNTNTNVIQAINDYAISKIEQLDKYLDGIMDVKLEIGLVTRKQQKGKIFRCELNLNKKNGSLRSEVEDFDLYTAITKSKADMVRKLNRFKKIRRRHRRLA